MNFSIILLASILAGCLYRAGGSDSFDTKVRDLGVPTIGILLMVFLYPNYGWKILLAYFFTFGLYFGALTTYFKKSGTEAKWWNWLFHGLGISLAFLPFALVSGLWLGFLLRCIVCSLGIMIWSEKISNVVWEEAGRGFLATITLPLLLI